MLCECAVPLIYMDNRVSARRSPRRNLPTQINVDIGIDPMLMTMMTMANPGRYTHTRHDTNQYRYASDLSQKISALSKLRKLALVASTPHRSQEETKPPITPMITSKLTVRAASI